MYETTYSSNYCSHHLDYISYIEHYSTVWIWQVCVQSISRIRVNRRNMVSGVHSNISNIDWYHCHYFNMDLLLHTKLLTTKSSTKVSKNGRVIGIFGSLLLVYMHVCRPIYLVLVLDYFCIHTIFTIGYSILLLFPHIS